MLIPHENNMIELGSSDEYDSDIIDSDVEAELYSSLHHEVNPVETNDNIYPSNKMGSNEVESLDEIIIISEDESDEDVINLNGSNDSKRSFCVDMRKKENNYKYENSPDNSYGIPKRKKCKVTNLAVETGNTDIKRKSNVVANLIETIQVQKQPKNKRKGKNKKSELSCSSRDKTIEISDSDSDMDLSDLDESGVQYVHTSLSWDGKQSINDSIMCLGSNKKRKKEVSDIISLNSDSEDDSLKFEFSFDGSNCSFNSPSQDLWKINDTDLYRIKGKSGGRYHEDAVAVCTNCNLKGHTTRYCLEPKVFKCPICGGPHSHFKCTQRMCEKCLRFGHSGKHCFLPVDQFLCSICNMRGHLMKVCPDLWRRYHLTTSGEQIKKAKKHNQEGPIYCSNCGEPGHFGFQCLRRRIENSYATLPAVVSYDHPLESLQKSVGLLPLPSSQVPTSSVPVAPFIPLGEANPPENAPPAQSKKAKKKFEFLLRKKKAMMQKKIERRMHPVLQSGPQYTPKLVKLRRNDPRRTTEDILNDVRERLQSTPQENKRKRRRLKRKLKFVARAEQKRLTGSAV